MAAPSTAASNHVKAQRQLSNEDNRHHGSINLQCYHLCLIVNLILVFRGLCLGFCMFKTKLFTTKYVSRYFVSPLKHVRGCRVVSHELRHCSCHLGYISFSGYQGAFMRYIKEYRSLPFSQSSLTHSPASPHKVRGPWHFKQHLDISGCVSGLLNATASSLKPFLR